MISIIAAMAENRVIGKDNALPWHLPADMRHLRTLTTGHAVIMGRKNFESIGRPLPERLNIIVTHNPHYRAQGCITAHSMEAALEQAGDDPEVFIFGGAEIYKQMLPRADRMYVTLVHAHIDGDTWFPEFNEDEWQEIQRETHEADAQNPYPYTFLTLDRVRDS